MEYLPLIRRALCANAGFRGALAGVVQWGCLKRQEGLLAARGRRCFAWRAMGARVAQGRFAGGVAAELADSRQVARACTIAAPAPCRAASYPEYDTLAPQ